MKKNWTTRVAVALLALTMITSCFVGSTFAKYVTKAEGTDNARVAKWGILVGVNGDGAFAERYAKHDNTYEGDYTVETSVEGEKLVAPGTDSGEDGLVGTVTGTPEVAVRYTLEIKDWEDVFLPAGDYTDYTKLVQNDDGEYGYFDTFTVPECGYAPVKWDITVTNGTTTIGLLSTAAEMLGINPAENGIYGFSATEAKEIMSNYATQLEDLLMSFAPAGARSAKVEVDENDVIKLSMDFDPNTEMDYTFKLTWKWNFEGQMAMVFAPSDVTNFNATLVDQCDTYLGNIAAEVENIEVPDDANIWVRATVTATATQID